MARTGPVGSSEGGPAPIATRAGREMAGFAGLRTVRMRDSGTLASPARDT